MQKSMELPCPLQTCHSLSWLCPCPPTQKFSEPDLSGFWWRLHFTGMINYIMGHQWLNSLCSPPSPDQRLGGVSESSNPLITCLVVLAIAPPLSGVQKSPSLRHPCHLSGSEVFPGTMDEDQIYLRSSLVLWRMKYVFLINHYIAVTLDFLNYINTGIHFISWTSP